MAPANDEARGEPGRQAKPRARRQAGAASLRFSCLRSIRRGACALAGAAIVGAALPAGAAVAQAPRDMHLPQMRLAVGGHAVQAEIAATEASQSQGLMYRKSLAPDHGMLFVFEQAGPFCFWMKNTLVPLSIAFISGNGTIVNIADMQPQTETPHCPAQPVLYALEMQQGWFARHRVHAGQKVADLPRP
ncbi:DUF192 domain-containing protein [Candidimonas nitroreducens]|uniref:DUF192 domain-containing protein n=1 Tax=Candidimonas nitroreducens TaxID=683354 RepID=A0A225LY69_9BURK|nr:DUF192 domain-containing protein [Candidimonas nitroreducens]OWT53482.1 hypothetical protein CEY11_24555 [Candidimonas nitroreducens]